MAYGEAPVDVPCPNCSGDGVIYDRGMFFCDTCQWRLNDKTPEAVQLAMERSVLRYLEKPVG